MKQSRYSFICLLLLLLFCGAVAAQELDAKLKEIDEYAVKAGQDWKVPGFAVAIVKDDKVIFLKGYGVRQLGKSDAVDKDTVFAIGSNTKAFTAAALATLVDEKKISWDDPVIKYMPSFQLYDPWVTREMTIRDLLSHRSGLATFAGDLIWYDTTYSRDEVIRRVRFLKPTTSFRSRFGYQNIMFLTAGELIPVIAGKSWDDYLRDKFFLPLGMTRTVTSYKQLLALPNLAMPHNWLNDNVQVIRYDNADNAGGAGAINSSAADMAQWVRLQLSRGTIDGKKIFSAERSREMWTPTTIVGGISEGAEKFNPTTHFNLYGLGWLLNDYQGRKLVSHGGGLDGMISRVALMPEENLGLVILTNSETALSSALSSKIFDVFLGVPKRDWSAELLARTQQGREAAKAEEKRIESLRLQNTKPSLALASYVGRYTGAMYGDARITEENGKLVLHMVPAPNFVADLDHWHLDTFAVKWRDSVVYRFGRGFVSFTVDSQGKVSEMKIDVPNNDFDFKEIELKRVP